MKKLPRELILAELKHFKVKPVFKGHERWTHQLVSFIIGCSYPEWLFLLDMGLGKSAILLDIMTQKQREGKLRKALVSVPRLINLGSWEADIHVHSEFEPILVEGTLEEKWEKLLTGKGDIAVIDYPGLWQILTKREKLKDERGKLTKKYKLVPDKTRLALIRDRYNFFGIDESHKVKNRDSLPYSLLKTLTARADFRYASTGTLFGRHPEDIWPQFYMIDRGATFGDTLGLFREAFFNAKDNGWGGTKYEFDKGMYRTLYRMLQHRSIRYTEDEVPEVEIPARVSRRINVKFADDQREHYLLALEGLINAGGRLADIDSAFVRMRQITAGYLQWSDEHGKHTVNFEENSKLQALETIVEESGESKLVVSHEFTASGQLISDMLTRLGYKHEWLHGGTKNPVHCVKRFIEDPLCKVFLMNSESGGTGTDGLQKVARHLVFYESPHSPITRTQTLKRVHRPGQLHRTFIWDIVMEKSIDLRILAMIEEGRSLYENIVNGRDERVKLKNLFS